MNAPCGPQRFTLPDLGEGLEDATIVAWHVAVGDHITVNAPLCTVETAKAEVEIPCPFEGDVALLAARVGDVVPVGELLAEVTAPGHDSSHDTEPATASEESPGGDSSTESGTDEGTGSVLVGYGTGPTTTGTTRTRRPAPPRTGGRRGAGAEAAGLAQNPRPEAPEVVPVTGVRARIARHLTDAHRDVPTAVAVRTIDCTAALALRDAAVAEARRRELPDVVTPFAVMAWAAVGAVRHVPMLNASFDAADAVIRVYPEVHLGIATSTERGLVVPVVRSAQRRGLLDLAAEIHRLASAARSGSLPPGELIGSTITLSNFGALGLDAGIPMLNPPEAAILGFGAVRDRAVVVGEDLVARPTVEVSCVFDHRAADGEEAAALLRHLGRLLEEPQTAWLDVPHG